MGGDPVLLRGAGRLLGGTPAGGRGAPVGGPGGAPAGGPGAPSEPLEIELGDDGFSFRLGGGSPRQAAYRDVAAIAIQPGAALLALGSEAGGPRLLCERFGEHLGMLVREMRDRRLTQRLADRFIDLPDDGAIELVEYAREAAGAPFPGESGIAQLAYHDRGFVLAPLDDRLAWHVVPRAAIVRVEEQPEVGGVRVALESAPPIHLVRVGPASRRHAMRLAGLRDAALADAGAIVGGLIPDAPFAARDLATSSLVDGRPCGPERLGAAWGPLERAVLTEPAFAESYRALVAKAGGETSLRWLAIAPEQPGSPVPRAWFFVALPGNLVAMELVSAGAHATYLFRVVPRGTYAGEAPGAMQAAYEAAVGAISETLVDIRFLREPIGLPETSLGSPEYMRYRLAIAALPSLAAARARFVGRVVHDDGWSAAVDDVIAWHRACRDDAATWPGRARQEAAILGTGDEPGTAVLGGGPVALGAGSAASGAGSVAPPVGTVGPGTRSGRPTG